MNSNQAGNIDRQPDKIEYSDEDQETANDINAVMVQTAD